MSTQLPRDGNSRNSTHARAREAATKPFGKGFGKAGFARRLFLFRFHRLKISRRAFAARYGLSYAMMRDVEQGHQSSRPLLGLVAMIEHDPTLAAAIVANAAAR